MKRTLSMILSTIFLLKKSHCSRGIRMRSVAYLSQLFYIFVFLMTTFLLTQFASADFLVANGSATEDARVIYSTWRAASEGLPAGNRTQGWYTIKPGGFTNLSVPAGNRSVYIRVEDPYGNEIEPLDHTTRGSYSFWMHPTKAFKAVQTTNGDFLDSNINKASLETATLYEYTNEGIHIITKSTECDPVAPADLSAQLIYDQAIDSVVWIRAKGDNVIHRGSGVLIDKGRKFIITNQHVIDNAERISVFFPYKDQNGKVRKESDFYEDNMEWLFNNNYATEGRVIAQNVENDLAIVQLDSLLSTAREIQHDFSRNVEDSMKKGNKVHILGNPGDRLWNYTQGTYLYLKQTCTLQEGELVGCLVMEGDVHGGNSGGPVLNGQGVLIGILSAGTDETSSLAATTKNIKALLDTVGPKHTFRIRNNAGLTLSYLIKWSDDDDWSGKSLESGKSRFHWWTGEVVPQGYPKIAFDGIVGDAEVTWHIYPLDTFLRYFGDNYGSHVTSADAKKYVFKFNRWSSQLYIATDGDAAAPMFATADGTRGTQERPKETTLLANYPNPFNPETWIPYQLANPADVSISIHAADGKVVRTLKLGNMPAGRYQSRSRAAHWDGKNAVGEPVASGVYFYTLKAGDFTATRKLLIRK